MYILYLSNSFYTTFSFFFNEIILSIFELKELGLFSEPSHNSRLS